MKELENETIRFWIENGILYSEYIKSSIGDYEVIKSVIDLRHEISNNEKQYWCYDIKDLTTMNKEARDYANIHGQDFLHGCAVIVNSHITKFIFNAFLMIKKPKIPFKAFNNKTNAVEWLKELKSKNE